MQDADTDQNMDLLVIELAHVIWFCQRGQDIEDVDELHAAWRDENEEARAFAGRVIREMYERGITMNFYDKSLSRFAPAE